MDTLDRQLIHALQVDGRAPFHRLAAVLGVSDQTVARRYRRLRSAGLVRVVGQVDPWRAGRVVWHLRLRCAPDGAIAVAEALARRPDTFWVHLISGGTEINCVTQARSADERDTLLLQKLPRTPRVVSVSAHCLLHRYFGGPMQYPAVVEALDADQVEALRPDVDIDLTRVELSEADQVLLDALGRDGRAGYAELASATGWSESTTRRRLEYLRRTGVLYIDLDLNPRALGFDALALLWLGVPPSKLDEVGRAVGEHPEVAFVAATTGTTNLIATVVCRSVRELYGYLTGRLGALEAVSHLETTPIIRTVKSAGAILGR